MADPDWFDLATEGQLEAFKDIAARFPDSQYGVPVQLVSADSGATYPLPVGATGHMEVYASLTDIPDRPLYPGADFITELGLLRIPHNRTRAFAAGPYIRAAFEPGVIDANNDPTIQPMSARILIVDKMLTKWASRPASGADPSFYDAQYAQHFDGVLTELATQYNMQGSAAGNAERAPWFR